MANPASLAGFAGAVGAGASFAFKNRIINGDMRIDQRNNGASTTPAGYCVDRWSTASSFGGVVYTQQQLTDAPAGFTNSLRITVTTPATPTAGGFTFSRQIIEGFNIADLGWGTSSAAPVTVSFWVKASIAGTYSAFLINHAEDRSYVATFTINAANTWEQKIFTVPGDTSGTWLTNNSNGIRFGFDMGSGSNFQGTANAWQSGWRQRTNGTVNFCQNSGATFQYTGVQLEKGSVATPFEFRSITQELALCQRYYQIASVSYDTVIASNGGANYAVSYPFTCEMRAAPTLVNSTIASNNASAVNADSFPFDQARSFRYRLTANPSADGASMSARSLVTASAEL